YGVGPGWNRGRFGSDPYFGSYHTQRDPGTQVREPALSRPPMQTRRWSSDERIAIAGVDPTVGKLGRTCGSRRSNVAARVDLRESMNSGGVTQTLGISAEPYRGCRAI